MGQFGQFRVNAYNLKWFGLVAVAFPAYLYYVNEAGVKWQDEHIWQESPNELRMGRTSWKMLMNDYRNQ